MNHEHAHHQLASAAKPSEAKRMEDDIRQRFFIALAFTVPVFLYSPIAKSFGLNLPEFIPANWILLIFTTPIVFWSGSIFIIGTYNALKSRILDMSVLIATGVLAAYLFSVVLTFTIGGETFYEAAAMLVTFVLFGHWMEMRSRRGTYDALQALFELTPPQAVIERDGKEVTILTAQIVKGDIVVVKPGGKIPVDGEIIFGETSVDESLITGESLPIFKSVHDAVVGGSINQDGSIKFRAIKIGNETVLAQIIKMVEVAQNSKAPGQRLADQAAAYLVILAISVGVVTFFGWYVFGGATIFVALTFAISAVVVACPDALGLATPTAVAVGTGLGAKNNILIKDAATLEGVSKINTIILDKTGTLTEGRPRVTDVLSFNNFTEDEVLKLEGALEVKSSHPTSRAIIDEVKKRGLISAQEVEKFESFAGRGIKGLISGKEILSGTIKLMSEQGVNLDTAQEELKKILMSGKSITLTAVDKKIVGLIAVADAVRPTSQKTISALKVMGLEVVMITGDNKIIAEAIGRELGIDRVFAEVLPAEKSNWVKKLQSEGKLVAMVGDGINDAPALAQSDIGIAIGAGTDAAIEAGNIVLMKSDPYDIVAAIRLSRATVNKMKQNLFWAVIYNILAIPIAAGVFYNSLGWSLRPEISALLMSLSSIIVATNAVLLKNVESKLKV